VVIAAVTAGLWFGLSYFERGLRQPPAPMMQSGGVALPQPRLLKPFALTAEDGTPFTEATLRGHWTFLAFGYTRCPDVCPTTLATYKEIERLLGADVAAGKADFVFVSVDPERDSPEQIGQYVRYFNPRFRGATGPHDSIRALTDQLGILYARAEGQDTALGYLVDHSATIILIDPQGRLAAIFSPPQDPRAVAEDFATLTRVPSGS
jgi:protein SCO1